MEENASNNAQPIEMNGGPTPPPEAPKTLSNPLLGDINAENAENSQNSESNDPNKWFMTPEMAGEGEKPEWFNDKKFKNIMEQAKSYEHVRKMLGQRTGAPEEYELELSNLGKEYEGLEIDKDDPLLAEFSKFAKNEKLSQEGFNEVLKMFVDYSNMQNSKESEQLAEFQRQELEALGGPEEAKKEIGEMTQWFKQNFPDFDAIDFQDMMYFAGGVKILKAMREKMRYSPVPQSAGDNSGQLIDHDSLKQMIADPRYERDPVYQKKVDDLYGRKFG
jgi:hypothetical protein